jgi:hypothetical protein
MDPRTNRVLLIEENIIQDMVNLDPADWDDWQWLGTGVNPPGATAPAVLTEVNADEWHWVFVNNTVKVFPNQQITHRYKEHTDIQPHLHFVSTTSELYTGAWTAIFTMWADGGDGTLRQAQVTRTLAFNEVMTAGVQVSRNFNGVLSGGGRKISSTGTITLKLALTAGVGLFITGFDGHHQSDRLGSRLITAKG